MKQFTYLYSIDFQNISSSKKMYGSLLEEFMTILASDLYLQLIKG